MSTHIIINEVGLRDGLQNQPKLVPTEQKLALLEALLAADITHLEAASFVSPKGVPQMADAEAFWRRLPRKECVDYSALVPNIKGYERARAAGVGNIAVVLGATETFDRHNVNMSLEESAQASETVMRRAHKDGIVARAYIAVAFACPYEGAVDPRVVRELTARMFAAGAVEVGIADTIGHANPNAVSAMFDALARDFGAERLSGHFHDTQGLALANCWAAAERGVRKFDAAIGGLGGCPFAPGAAGNVATEDVVHLFENAGFLTGVALEGLAEAVCVAEATVGTPLGGHWLRWRRGQTWGEPADPKKSPESLRLGPV